MASILQFLTRRETLIGLAVFIVLYFGSGFAFRWTDEKMVAQGQEQLFRKLSAKSWSGCAKLLSESYHDRWNFSKEDAATALKDVGRQFMSLHVGATATSITLDKENARATAEAVVRMSGTGGPFCSRIVAEANQLRDPFIFEWRKESWHPWSWRIIRIDQPGLPAELYGYKPGDFGRAMSGGGLSL